MEVTQNQTRSSHNREGSGSMGCVSFPGERDGKGPAGKLVYGKTEQQGTSTNCPENHLPTTSATRPEPQDMATRFVAGYLRSYVKGS